MNPEDKDEKPPDEAEAHLMELADAMEAGDTEEAQAAFAEFLEDLGKFMEEHQDDQDPHSLLMQKAADLAEAGDQAGAEAAWREALEISESDAQAIRPCQHLVSLYSQQGRHEDALAIARRASDHAARTDMEILRAMTAETEARCLFEMDDFAGAIAAATRAFAFQPKMTLSDGSRARVLVFRARCAQARGDADAAERDLADAWEILQRPTTGVFGPPSTVLAAWWAVTARLRAARGDKVGAVAAWEECVEHRKAALEPGFLDPGPLARENLRRSLADTYQSLGEARQAAGDLPGAEEAFLYQRSITSTLNNPSG